MLHQFNLRSTFSCSGVVILDALAPSDLQTARRLHEDLAHLRAANGAPWVHYRSVPDRRSLFSALKEIELLCRKGFRPVLHFDGHGTKEKGLNLGSSGEFTRWTELGDSLLTINTTTRNNLGVVMAACYGLYQMDAVDIEKPCPYNFLIAPPEEVPAGFIDDRMRELYNTLFRTRSLVRAVTCLDSKFIQFHAESFFCLVFARYLKHMCAGRVAAERNDRFLTQAVHEGFAPNRDRRRELRKVFKHLIKRPEPQFYRMSRKFLHGQRSVRYEDLESFVRARNA